MEAVGIVFQDADADNFPRGIHDPFYFFLKFGTCWSFGLLREGVSMPHMGANRIGVGIKATS